MEQGAADRASKLLLPSSLLDPRAAVAGRYPHLDVTRVCCIACVALHTFDERFAEHNVLWATNWVMPLLWLTSGICYGLSNKSLLRYILRLAAYLGVGLFLNTAAWLVVVRDLRISDGTEASEPGAPPWIIASHIIFVFWLMIFVALLAPLKRRMASHAQQLELDAAWLPGDPPPQQQDDRESPRLAAMLGLGVLMVLAMFALTMGSLRSWLGDQNIGPPGILGFGSLNQHRWTSMTKERLLLIFDHVWHACMPAIASLGVVLSAPRIAGDHSAVVWLLLFIIYCFRLAYGYGEGDYFIHGFNLMITALAAHVYGIRWRQSLSKFAMRYWMVLAFACACLGTPDLSGPLLDVAPEDWYVRSRFVLQEALLVTAWLVASDRMIDPKIYTHDRVLWVNDWAFIVFLMHQAVAWSLPRVYGAFVLLALGPICYGLRWMSGSL